MGCIGLLVAHAGQLWGFGVNYGTLNPFFGRRPLPNTTSMNQQEDADVRVVLSRTCAYLGAASCRTLPIDIDSCGQSYHFRFAPFLLLEDAVTPPPTPVRVALVASVVTCACHSPPRCAAAGVNCSSEPGGSVFYPLGVCLLRVMVCPCDVVSGDNDNARTKDRCKCRVPKKYHVMTPLPVLHSDVRGMFD